MSGTRKLGKYELGRQTAFQSGTRRLEKFEAPGIRPITTPIEEISPAVLAAARRSIAPAAPVDEPPTVAVAKVEVRTVEQMRTRLARKFTTLADEITASFAGFHIGAGSWHVQLTAPEGMSTSGGREALQHLRLRPTRQGHPVLIGGVVNSLARTAELRDYPHMEMLHRARFGRPLEISAGEWEQFLRKAEVVLGSETITTSRVAAPRELLMLSRTATAVSPQRKAAAIALALVVFLVTIVAWRVAHVLWP